MTTFARGVSAPKRAVGAFTGIMRQAIDREAIVEANRDARSAITAEAAERKALRREHAWVDAAATAAVRMYRPS